MAIILKRQVPEYAVNKAHHKITHIPEEERDWPVHRYSPEIMGLLAHLPAVHGELCDPQIVLQSPDSGQDYSLNDFHRDSEPIWAKEGQEYIGIYGVAVTRQNKWNGGVAFGDADYLWVPRLNIGDIIIFGKHEEHTAGENTTEYPRIVVYFRFLNL